jgi:hypothetical protein
MLLYLFTRDVATAQDDSTLTAAILTKKEDVAEEITFDDQIRTRLTWLQRREQRKPPLR